jgi:hypothetical protein
MKGKTKGKTYIFPFLFFNVIQILPVRLFRKHYTYKPRNNHHYACYSGSRNVIIQNLSAAQPLKE